MKTWAKPGAIFSEISPCCKQVTLRLLETPLEKMENPRQFFTRIHLLLCRPCRAYRQQAAVVDKILGEYPTRWEELSAERLSQPARERIRAQLQSLEKRNGSKHFSS